MSEGTTGAARSQPDPALGDLRHRLRTPLNHIIGYSELLLDGGSGLDDEARIRLTSIRTSAQIILALIQECLAPGQSRDSREGIERLRSEIAAPLNSVIGNAGNLAQRLHGQPLIDLLRINTATTDLLAFAQGGDAGAMLPASPARAGETRPSAMHQLPSRLLVVDDNDANCDVLGRQLVRHGHTVTCVASGADALRALDTEPFDLVLLDVMMPGLTGFEVLRTIKTTPSLCNLPVIMMSALDELESAAQCIQMGAEDYLLKPCDPVLLLARLQSALERKRLHELEQERTRELEQASGDLKRANEDLNRFAFAASHDLQEPLRTVTTSLQLLSRQLDEKTSENSQLLNLALDAAKRMSNLISDLLAYSVASGEDRVSEPVDASLALEDAVANLRRSIDESGAAITYDALPSVLFERAQLCQVFQNLIGNAIKYRGESKPEIDVSAAQRGDDWVFAVRDKGMGIPDQYTRAIFEPFRRLHGHNLPGTGLGLAICKRIIEGFGGRIWVESTAGTGSTFRFTAHRSGRSAEA